MFRLFKSRNYSTQLCRLVKLKCDCIPLLCQEMHVIIWILFVLKGKGGGSVGVVIGNHLYHYQKDKKTFSKLEWHNIITRITVLDQPLAGYCRINNILSQILCENITYWGNLTSFQVTFRFTNLSAPLQSSSSFPSMFLTITDIRFLELLNSKIFKSL